MTNQPSGVKMDEQQIFLATLEKTSAAEQNAYLDQACGDNQALRKRIEDLLKAHREANGFLENPPIDHVEGTDVAVEGGTTDNPTVPLGECQTGLYDSQVVSLEFMTPSDRPIASAKLASMKSNRSSAGEAWESCSRPATPDCTAWSPSRSSRRTGRERHGPATVPPRSACGRRRHPSARRHHSRRRRRPRPLPCDGTG